MIIDQLFTRSVFEDAAMASPEQLAYNRLRAQYDSYQTMTGGGGNTAVSRDPAHAAKLAKVPAELARMAAALKAKGIDAEAEYDALGGPAAAPVDANQAYGSVSEVAPPGAKAERMVKHIKQGYARDGKLTPKEKGIAFATAWKAHNAGQVEEGEITKNATGLTHRATDKYGAGDDEPHHYTGGRSGFSEPGKYARDLEHVNKQLVKDLDASMGITWKNRGPKGLEVDEQGVEEATGDERFDNIMSRIRQEPRIPDPQMPPTDVRDLYHWAVKHHKPYHKIFAKWANREGFKSVAPALQKAGNLDSDAIDYWTPDVWKLWYGPDAEMPRHWSKQRVPDELRDYLETVFDAYDRIVFDWPTEYLQIKEQGVTEDTMFGNDQAFIDSITDPADKEKYLNQLKKTKDIWALSSMNKSLRTAAYAEIYKLKDLKKQLAKKYNIASNVDDEAQGVAEGRRIDEVFADQGSGSTDRDNEDYMKRRRAANKAGYTGRETKAGTWRVFKDGNAVAAAGPFKSADEAAAWIKKHKQGITEMDKSQTPPGRDTGPRSGPEKIAKPITPEKMVTHALDVLAKSMAKKDDKKKDVKESNTLMIKLKRALVREGRVKELADDLKTMSDADFMKKYGKAKAAIRKDMKRVDEATPAMPAAPAAPAAPTAPQSNRQYSKTYNAQTKTWTTNAPAANPMSQDPAQRAVGKQIAANNAASSSDIDDSDPGAYDFDHWVDNGMGSATPILKSGVIQNLFTKPLNQVPPGAKIIPKYDTYQQQGEYAYPVIMGGIDQAFKVRLDQVPKGAKIVPMPTPGGNLYKDLSGSQPAAKPATPAAPAPVSERKGTRRLGEARTDYTPEEMADMLSGKRSQKQIDADAERTRGPNKAPPTKESTQSRAKRLNEKLAASDTLAAGPGISRLGKKDMEPKLDFRTGLDVGDDESEFFEPDVRIGKPVEPDKADTDAFMSAVDSYGEQNPYMQSWGGKYADQDTRVAPLRPGEFNVGGTTWRRVEDPAAAPAKKEVQWIPSSEADSIASWKANNPGKSAADWGPASIPAASKSSAAGGAPKTRWNVFTHEIEKLDPRTGTWTKMSDGSGANPNIDAATRDRARAWAAQQNAPGAALAGAMRSSGKPVDTAKSKTDWKTIYNLNKSIIGDNPNSIKPGMKLKMPNGSTYRVQPGDNLSKIAANQSSINEQSALPPDQAARLAPYLQKGADGSQYYNLPTTNPGETGATMGQTNISPAALAQIKSPQGQQGIIKQLLAMTEPKNAVPQSTTTATDVSGQYSGGLEELSTNQLARYKTAAAKDAQEADKEGDFKRGDKRFHGIVQATKKQFDNDAKQVDESRAARRALMARIVNHR